MAISRVDLRRWAVRAFFALFGAICLGVVVQWFIQVATDKGWYADAGRLWDRLMAGVIGFLTSSPVIAFALLLGGFVAGLLVDAALIRREGKKTEDQPLIEIRGRNFRNETVELDGHRYIACQFHNVTFRYGGAKYEFHRNHVAGYLIEPTTDTLSNFGALLFQFGCLKHQVITQDGPVQQLNEHREIPVEKPE